MHYNPDAAYRSGFCQRNLTGFSLDLPNMRCQVDRMSTESSEVMFICTGNYYRSRFAQAIFNLNCEERGLSWCAFSRGLWLQPWVNPGTISPHTKKVLKERGIPLEFAGDIPRDVTLEDLERASVSIALKKAEHYPLMQRDFPEYAEKITYWSVHDLDCAGPEEALPQIEKQVLELIDWLESKQ